MSSEHTENLVKLAGFVYGDGFITKQGQISFTHSIQQEEYAMFKANKLSEYFGLKYSIAKREARSSKKRDGTIINSGKLLRITCHSKTWTKKIRTLWYNENGKNIPSDILEQFGPEEFAYLFQDDGRCNKISHFNKIVDNKIIRIETSPVVNRYEFCLGYPSIEQLEALQKALKNFEIVSWKLNRKDGQKNLSISKTTSKQNFKTMLLPYIHASMQYKINFPVSFQFLKMND